MIITITGRSVRKTCIRLSSFTNTDIDYFLKMPLHELADFAADVQEVNQDG